MPKTSILAGKLSVSKATRGCVLVAREGRA